MDGIVIAVTCRRYHSRTVDFTNTMYAHIPADIRFLEAGARFDMYTRLGSDSIPYCTIHGLHRELAKENNLHNYSSERASACGAETGNPTPPQPPAPSHHPIPSHPSRGQTTSLSCAPLLSRFSGCDDQPTYNIHPPDGKLCSIDRRSKKEEATATSTGAAGGASFTHANLSQPEVTRM